MSKHNQFLRSYIPYHWVKTMMHRSLYIDRCHDALNELITDSDSRIDLIGSLRGIAARR